MVEVARMWSGFVNDLRSSMTHKDSQEIEPPKSGLELETSCQEYVEQVVCITTTLFDNFIHLLLAEPQSYCGDLKTLPNPLDFKERCPFSFHSNTRDSFSCQKSIKSISIGRNKRAFTKVKSIDSF
jgi:hypothetical protein